MANITASLHDGYAVTISNGRHIWKADEPIDVGGTDTGPNPYELLLGSLAACTCITISMYCKQKGLSLHSVQTSYDFSRVHAEDCKHCDEADEGLIEEISTNVHISGEFDEAQRKRLTQIAGRCPVHKTLAKGVKFDDNASFD